MDAYLFGYLSILYRAPFVGSQLKSHLTICSNLCSLINRAQKDHFPIIPKGIFFTTEAAKSRNQNEDFSLKFAKISRFSGLD